MSNSFNIIQEITASNVDESVDKSQNEESIELLEKMEDVSEASSDM